MGKEVLFKVECSEDSLTDVTCYMQEFNKERGELYMWAETLRQKPTIQAKRLQVSLWARSKANVQRSNAHQFSEEEGKDYVIKGMVSLWSLLLG